MDLYFLSLLRGQQTENPNPGRCTYVDFSIRDHWSEVLVPHPEVIAVVGSLVRVIELHQALGVVGVQHRGIRVLGGPDNRVQPAIRRDAGSCSRIPERI